MPGVAQECLVVPSVVSRCYVRIQSELPVLVYRQRALKMALVTLIIILGLIARLAYLQFMRGDELSAASMNNYLREERLPAERGAIYDRNMNPMAVHVRTFNWLSSRQMSTI